MMIVGKRDKNFGKRERKRERETRKREAIRESMREQRIMNHKKDFIVKFEIFMIK